MHKLHLISVLNNWGVKSLLLVQLLFTACTMQDSISKNENPTNKEEYLTCVLNKIDTIPNNEVDDSYNYRGNFVFGDHYIFDICFPGGTKSYNESKSYVMTVNKMDSNSFMAMKIDKKYGIDNYLFAKYYLNGDTAKVIVYNQYNNAICDVDIAVNDGFFAISKVYDDSTSSEKGITPCNIIVSTTGNILTLLIDSIPLGVAATIVFMLLENWICDQNTIVCPKCGASGVENFFVNTQNSTIECKICGHSDPIQVQ